LPRRDGQLFELISETDLKRVVEPGRFRVTIGGCSAEVKSVGLEVVGP
jgi:hypothetical protein